MIGRGRSSRRPMAGVMRVVLLAVGLSTVWPAGILDLAAAAQEPSESRPARPGPRGRGNVPPRPVNPDNMTVPQVEQYFDDVVLFQAQSRLQLSDEQFLKFGPALRQLQDARRQQQRRRMQVLRDINALLGAPNADDTAISARLEELENVAADGARRVQDARAAIDAVLTVRQRARFRVFEENMERRKLDLLARARGQGGGPASRGRDPR